MPRSTIVILCIILLLSSCGNESKLITLSPSYMNLGVIYGGEYKAFSCSIYNGTTNEIILETVTNIPTGVQFSNYAVGAKIVPNTTRYINIRLDPLYTSNKIEGRITFPLKGRTKIEKSISFSYHGVPTIQPIPIRLFLLCNQGEETYQEVILRGINHDMLDRIEWKTSNKYIEIEDYDIVGNPPIVNVKLNVKFSGIPQGDFIGGILVHDYRVHEATTIIPILGQSMEPIIAKPSKLFLKRGERTSIKLVTRKDVEYRIASVVNNYNGILKTTIKNNEIQIELLKRNAVRDEYEISCLIDFDGKKYKIIIPIFIQ